MSKPPHAALTTWSARESFQGNRVVLVDQGLRSQRHGYTVAATVGDTSRHESGSTMAIIDSMQLRSHPPLISLLLL